MRERQGEILTLFQEIYKGNSSSFDRLFLLYYDKLVAFATQYTRQPENAEEIVSDLFVKIWVKRDTLPSILNPGVYLFVSVKNACLNLIRASKKRSFLFVVDEAPDENIGSYGNTAVEDKELEHVLDEAVRNLPQQRKIIFKLIKEDGFKSREVAEILTLSTRTVENQLYKAVNTLTDVVSNYLGYHPKGKSRKQVIPIISLLFFNAMSISCDLNVL